MREKGLHLVADQHARGVDNLWDHFSLLLGDLGGPGRRGRSRNLPALFTLRGARRGVYSILRGGVV